MMKQYLRITISVLLIAVFMVFNVGLPVVYYLCPMMSADNPVCSMMPTDGSRQSAITNVIPACCTKYIVAERNTTPFLKIQDAAACVHEVTFAQSFVSPNPSAAERLIVSLHDEAPSHPSPLFILHSSLLI